MAIEQGRYGLKQDLSSDEQIEAWRDELQWQRRERRLGYIQMGIYSMLKMLEGSMDDEK